ncbi:protein LSM14 homolog B-like, partial [Brachionichthys hirsutus]|uniref:protein LSM14 homolog B-like n=1 Tax=Brachionichthys hirsutus TaxID=412623 RepID=UPI0036054579
YNQLAATSLLNQQYNAALGQGLHNIAARRAPMVEQAVQTVPLASAEPKEKASTEPQAKAPDRPAQLSGRSTARVQKENVPGSRAPAEEVAARNPTGATEKQKQRQKQGSRRSRNRSRGQLLVKSANATTLQFESDFDFETANAQFKNDLRKDVVVDKADALEPRDDRGSEEEEHHGDKYYDKSKCFFDNVSSELKPRRTSWAEEKKLNMETFGVPGRFLKGRGFRGRGRGRPVATDRRPLPKIGSGRV